jgi:hypothetical protein
MFRNKVKMIGAVNFGFITRLLESFKKRFYRHNSFGISTA